MNDIDTRKLHVYLGRKDKVNGGHRYVARYGIDPEGGMGDMDRHQAKWGGGITPPGGGGRSSTLTYSVGDGEEDMKRKLVRLAEAKQKGNHPLKVELMNTGVDKVSGDIGTLPGMQGPYGRLPDDEFERLRSELEALYG